MVTTSKNVTHRTGRFDPLWGEVVVLDAYSDWRKKGWMVCHEFIREGRDRASYHPKMFFTQESWEAAIKYANECQL